MSELVFDCTNAGSDPYADAVYQRAADKGVANSMTASSAHGSR